MFIPFSDVQLHCRTRHVTHLISLDSSFVLTHLCFNVAKEMHTLQNELFKHWWKEMWTACKKTDFVSGQYKLSVVTWPVSSSIMQYLIAYMSIHQHATGTVQSLPR